MTRTAHTPKPKHNRCTSCGRRAHKFVVVFPATAPQAKNPDGNVHGQCAGCHDPEHNAKWGGVTVATK